MCSVASPAISQILLVSAGRGSQERGGRGGNFRISLGWILRLSLSAKQWSVLKHSDKKWSYFLISSCCERVWIWMLYTATVPFILRHQSTRQLLIHYVSPASVRWLTHLWEHSTYRGNSSTWSLGEDRGCVTVRRFHPVAFRIEKRGTSYLPS